MLRTLIGLLAGVAGFLVACEAAFRVLPVSTATMTGYYIDPYILGYPAVHQWTAATGWDLRNPQRLQGNNLGFLADRPHVRDPRAVALIGDSYVEASMLPPGDRPGAQLERMLADTRPVYAMGGPGSSLLDYAERVRYAYQQLDIRDFVILFEAGDMRQSVCGSGNVHAVCLSPDRLDLRMQTQPAPSTLKKVLRHSGLAQYVSGQIRANPARFVLNAFVRKVPDHAASLAGADTALPAPMGTLSEDRARMVDAVTAAFFARIAETAPDARLLILADGVRKPGDALAPGVAAERQRFLQNARNRGLTVLDGEPAYARHALSSNLSLAVGPYDAHLNSKGVELLMSLAADALR